VIAYLPRATIMLLHPVDPDRKLVTHCAEHTGSSSWRLINGSLLSGATAYRTRALEHEFALVHCGVNSGLL